MIIDNTQRIESEMNGELLKGLREDLGLTADEFGRLVGLDGECITDFENNGYPNYLAGLIHAKVCYSHEIARRTIMFDKSGSIYYCPENIDNIYVDEIKELTKWWMNVY